MPESDPAKCTVGWENLEYAFVAVDKLADKGFSEIVLGPVTWDECAEFMRGHNQDKW